MRATLLFIAAVLCSGCASTSPFQKLSESKHGPSLGEILPPLLASHSVSSELAPGSAGASTLRSTATEDGSPYRIEAHWDPRLSVASAAETRSAVDARARFLTLDTSWDPEPSTALWFSEQARELSLAPVSTSGVDAESDSPSVAENPFSKAYLKLLLTDIKETFTAPAHWDTCDWLIAGGVAAGIGTLAVFDEDIQRAVQRNRNSTLDKISNDIQPFGADYAAGVLGAFYLGGLAFDNTRAKQVALDGAAASLIASGLILYPLKETVGRSRPGSNQGAYHFQPFSGSDSFPSGHTTEAFALATVISEHYDSIWIRLCSYGVAGMVGYARMNNNDHWASDVFAGAALGTFVGHVVVHVNQKHWKVSLRPILSPGMQGGEMAVSF